jgi:hypothetical protein
MVVQVAAFSFLVSLDDRIWVTDEESEPSQVGRFGQGCLTGKAGSYCVLPVESESSVSMILDFLPPPLDLANLN